MAVFVDIILSFPTVVFSVGLVAALLYWLMVIVGAMDIEVLDFGDGLLDGAMEGLDGSLDAADGALEGATEGAAEAADGAVDATAGALTPILFIANIFRVGRVPLTLSLSAFVLWGWIVGFVLTWLYQGAPGFIPHLAFSLLALLATVVIASALTNVSVRPLEPIFRAAHARERSSLLGEECVVTTGRVDSHFGQASAHLGSDDLLFQVRCDADNPLRRGDTALIVHWDDARHAFVVEPLAQRLLESERTVASPKPNPTLSEV